jgi:hypothetical protein
MESVSHIFVRKLLLKYVYYLQCKCLQIISEDRTRNSLVDSSHKGNTLRSFNKGLQKKRGTGRAVAQAVSHWLPQRRPGFASRQHVEFVVDKVALG